MEPPGSTLRGQPGEGNVGLRRLAARLLWASRGRLPPEKLAALLLPMVKRAMRTECGPAALVCWLRQRPGAPRTGHEAERAARKLAEELVRLLFDQPDLRDTLADLR